MARNWRFCRRRLKSSKRRLRRSAVPSGGPSSLLFARRSPGPGWAPSTSWRRHRENRAQRPNQGHAAVRNRGGARHPCAGRANGQSRRRPDRTRSDLNAAERDHLHNDLLPSGSISRGCTRRSQTGDDPVADFTRPRTRRVADRHAASAAAEPGGRASRQDCGT